MAIIIKIERRDIPCGPHQEIEVDGIKAQIAQVEADLPFKLVKTIEHTYYFTKFPGKFEIYIERENIDLFTEIMNKYFNAVWPTIKIGMIQWIKTKDEIIETLWRGQSFWLRLRSASFLDFYRFWRELRKEKKRKDWAEFMQLLFGGKPKNRKVK